ncbi:hypothetical protein [Pseudomonas sp. BN411]|uniref:hypothetical protein n=1 Tax=Pseudomonas sp. BN411 TaxID=2567887 RepID=UPI0024587C20|nr:hypothetical protein [Pseudomonas sp. BN411]MDH4563877.1 hypothetical protein [Pseudomonas sp. BN411]
MDCEFVVGLILYTNKGKAELDDCDQLLQARYGDKYVSVKVDFGHVNSLAYTGLPDMPNGSLLNAVSDVWSQRREFSGGLGLFIQAHGDATNIDARIDNAVLAITALYDLGLRFRKINVGWCFSGGNPGFTNADASTGVALIKQLVSALGTEDGTHQGLHKLHGATFCCYMAAITYKTPGKYQNRIQEFDASLQEKPRNFLNRSSRLTHPHIASGTSLTEYLDSRKPDTVNQNTLNNVTSQIQNNKNLQDAIKAAVEYLTRHKSAWKVVDGAVVRVGLDEYSDADYIRHMHQTIVVSYARPFHNG